MRAEDRYDSLLLFYAEKYNRVPQQVKRQIRVESNFDPNATSPVGAKGLLQFMPRTWEEWEDALPGMAPKELAKIALHNAYDPEASIRAGCSYMAWLENYFHNLTAALAAYNWGMGNVQKARQQDPAGWLTLAPKETQNYVKNCLLFQNEVITVVRRV